MSDTNQTETETGTNTDTTDEPSKAELHERVRKLESTVEKLMPSRRDALRMGAAGLVGAAGLSATSQPADASTGSAGTIGSSSDRPDLLADEVDTNNFTIKGGFQNFELLDSVTSTVGAGGSVSLNIPSSKNTYKLALSFTADGTNGDFLRITFNNITTADYHYITRSDQFNPTNGDTAFNLISRQGDRGHVGEWLITEQGRPGISGSGSGSQFFRRVLVSGELAVSVADLNSIEIKPQNTDLSLPPDGFIRLYGWD